MKTVLFFLLWGWASWKRGDWVRNKQTVFILLFFLIVPQLIRLLFLVFYPGTFSALTLADILQAGRIGLLYDLSMLALVGGLSLLLINIPVKNTVYRKGVTFFCALSLEFYAFMLVADLVYFRYVQRHIGPDIFNFFFSIPLVLDVAFKSYPWVCLGIVILSAVMLYAVGRYTQKVKPIRRGGWVYEFLFLAFLGFFLWYAERGYFFTAHPMMGPRLAYMKNLEHGHLTLNGVFNIFYHIMPQHYFSHVKMWGDLHPSLNEFSEEESLKITRDFLASPNEKWADTQYPLQRKRTHFSTTKRKKNLIIFALESLDFNSVDAASGNHHGATPNLDTLMNQGQIFDRFFSCTDYSSLLGIGASMSGLCWVSGAPYFGRGLEQITQNGLGRLFAQAGYEAVFVRACDDEEMYIGPLARLMGFKTFGSDEIKKLTGKRTVYDAEALEVLAKEFKDSDKPFIGFFFSTATHEPFESWSPKKLDARLEERFAKDPYLRALAYTDSAIGKFLQFLKDNGLYEDTAFVVVGDHHRREIGATVRESYHVPFALVAPGVLPAKHVQTIAGQVDLLPTLVDLFHLSVPYTAMGESLLEHTDKDWTFVTQGGHDFAFMTPEAFILSGQQGEFHQKMVALNKAAYTVLKNNRWAKY